jgi:hypothetical protein
MSEFLRSIGQDAMCRLVGIAVERVPCGDRKDRGADGSYRVNAEF